jgi:uncharacterized protein (TIGR02246 family)
VSLRMLRPLIPSILCLLSACQPPAPPVHTDEAATETEARQAIDSFRVRYAATWRAADAAALARLYTTDALLLYPGQPALRGQPAIQTYFEGFFAEFLQQDFALMSEEIQVTDHWAFDRGTVHWQAVPRAGGPPVIDDGKYLVILERQPDGSWRLARDMDNSDRPHTQSTRTAG